MSGIATYMIRITAVSMISAMAVKLIHKGLLGSMVRLVSGFVVLLCVISPIIHLRLEPMESYFDDIRIRGESIRAEGEKSSRDAMAQIITERTTAYILDRAETLALSLSVTVHLSESGMPIPIGVTLGGVASPYAREQMNKHITEGLGIDLEEIQWTH